MDGAATVPWMRLVLGVVTGTVVAFLAAVILGEYTFVGLTPWVAALLVPVAVAESCALVAGERPAWLWPFAAVVGAGALACGVWASTGRGLDPWPAGGSLAVGVGFAWPLLAEGLRRRSAAGAR